MILCPTNCEHDLPFAHTIITKTTGKGDERKTTVMLVCRECSHWVRRRGACPHVCHNITEAFEIDGTREAVIH